MSNTPSGDVLDRARDVLSELAGLDLDGLGGDELTEAVVGCQRLRGALDVAEARALARWDAEGHWRASGAKTAAAWLTWQQHLPVGVARQRMRHARAVRDLPVVAEAWAAGEIDRSHVTTLLNVRTPRTEEGFVRDHKELLDTARCSWFSAFKRHCAYWEQATDPDGAEQGSDNDRAGRELHLNQSFGGMWFGKITLDPVSGEIVNTTLAMIDKELYEADWATAKERLGRTPTSLELDRTPAQRRADALVEMASRARTAPKGGRPPAPLFTVVVGYETFAGAVLELYNRTVITPGTAARWLTQADVERVVFDTPSRVIEVGAKRRFYTGADRRAVEIRDRTCFHPTCDEPPQRPEIDHIHEASKGGPTTQDNGRLACNYHNRWRNQHPDTSSNDDNGDSDSNGNRDDEDDPDQPAG